MTETESATGKPERRTAEQWAVLVEECKASGKSQRRFCAERGIGQSTLRYWRRRLLGDAPRRRRIGAAQLVPVKVCEDEPSPAKSGLVLVVGRSVRVEVATDFDAATLQRVLASVGAVA